MSTRPAALGENEEQTGYAGEGSPSTGTTVETSQKVGQLYRTKRLFWRFEIGTVTTRKRPDCAYPEAQQPVREPVAQPVRAFPAGAPKALAAAPEMGVAAAMAPALPPAPGGANGGTTETQWKVYFDMTAGTTDMPPPDPPGPPKM